jgi:ankyrin repeat protein
MLLEHGAAPNDGSLYEAIVMHNLRTNETTGEATRPRIAHANTLTLVDLIARLLDRGADPNRIAGHTLHADGTGQPAPVNESPFVQALRAQDVAALRLLLRKGASANLITEAGFTPLMVAMGAGAGRGGFAGGFGAVPAGFRHPSERSPIEAVKVLLDAGADVNGAARNGDTALHTAAQSGNVAMIQLLADRGVTLDVQNKAGLTPLDLAMGKRAPGADAGRGGRGGGPGRGGAGGGPQPQAVVLLRKLMGLPALPPESLPGPAALTPPVRGDLA